uniref:Uncharacterized protein n=1 Tax=Thermobia domestica TaxID=89055 RepID=A4FSG7_THEDO|nr:hypothetical protein [Thermobia domestica]
MCSNREISGRSDVFEASEKRIRKKLDYGEPCEKQRKDKCWSKTIFIPRSLCCIKNICPKIRLVSAKELKQKL